MSRCLRAYLYANSSKVFYYFQDQASAPDILDGIHPADSIPFLEIFYTDYEWTPQSRANWLRSPHYERLYRLNIRREPSLPTGSQMMPVTICYHSDDSQNIEIRKGSGTAVLCYGTDGAMYIGLLADLTKTAQICHGDNVYNIHGRGWIASKGNLTQFQMHSGLQAAQVLHAMYAAGHPKMFQNATIMKTCAARIMLYEISIEAQRWRQNVEKALKDYTHAAKENIMVAVSSFVNEDENWATLSLDEKRLVCRIWELKYEALGYHDVTFKVNLDASEP